VPPSPDKPSASQRVVVLSQALQEAEAMKKAVSIWCFPGGTSIKDAMRQAKEAGFDGIELAMAEEGELSLQTSPFGVKALRLEADRIGIEISSLATGLGWKYSLFSNDPKERAQAKAVHKKALRAAQILDLDVILSVPGALKPDIRYDVAYQRTVKAYQELAPAAEAYGVKIGVEVVWNKFLYSPMEFARLIDDVGHPYVQAYFDAGNVLVFGYPQHWIEILGKRIVKVHVKDFLTSVGNITGFRPLLHGDVPFPEVVKALQKVGYDDYLIAEVGPSEEVPREKLLKQTSEALTKIIGYGGKAAKKGKKR